MINRKISMPLVFTAVIFMGIFVFQANAFAHCDTLDGPVITDAKAALEKGDITPVLKWVKKEYEPEVRQAFNKTLAVMAKGDDAKELADMYFFETLVRVHRAGEGASFTGLKPAGVVEPVVVKADEAIEKGSVDELAKKISDVVFNGIKEHFVKVMEAKKHINESVEAGRGYVEAYVKFVHYIEGIHNMASGRSAHHLEPSAVSHKKHSH